MDNHNVFNGTSPWTLGTNFQWVLEYPLNQFKAAMMTRLSPWGMFGAVSAALASQDAFQTRCSDFAHHIDLPNVSVHFAEYVAGGTNLSLPENAASCAAPYQAVSVDVCRVAMTVSTSNSSEISLEAWFPRDYKGRFLSTGNGGLSGCMCHHHVTLGVESVVLTLKQASNTTIWRTLHSWALPQSGPTTDTMVPPEHRS